MNENTVVNSAIADAVLAAGSQSALARAVGVSPQAVQQWVDSGRVPLRRVLYVERATGVSRTRLRPDIYPADEAVPASSHGLAPCPVVDGSTVATGG